jgi:PilZ domain
MNEQLHGKGGLRPARMPIRSAILMSCGSDAWSSEIEDISATGVLVSRPEVWGGRIGDLYALDMLIGEALNIHVEARLARITDNQLGFAYARIPEDKEVPLWNLLGGYADRLEPYEKE